MKKDITTEWFLSTYPDLVIERSMKLRKLILENLTDITEQVDVKAKMIGYAYGQKYSELICMIIPSKKGVKLSFNRGVSLSNKYGMLQGNGKITRYVSIDISNPIRKMELKDILMEAQGKYEDLFK